jgi:hypothetical protein
MKKKNREMAFELNNDFYKESSNDQSKQKNHKKYHRYAWMRSVDSKGV